MAGLARQVRLRPRGGSHGAAPTLEARVSERLRTREIDTVTARWDSRRTDKGAWTVLLLFTAGGREREAAWQFDPLARTVSAVDDEARWLSEDEDQQAPGPIPAPHLSASSRPSRVYDVEAEGGVGASTMRRREGETVDLMAAMRERSAQRGRRRRPKSTEVPGLDEAPEEALPLEELAGDPRDELPPPAHTHPEDDPEVVKTGSVEQRVGVDAARRKARRTEPTQPVRQAPEPTATDQDGSQEADPAPAEPESVGTREPERAPAAEPESGAERHGSHEVDLDDDGADIADDVADEAPAEPRPRRAAAASRHAPTRGLPTAVTRPCGAVRSLLRGRRPRRVRRARGRGLRRRGAAGRGPGGQAGPPTRPSGTQVGTAERAELGRHHVRPQERLTAPHLARPAASTSSGAAAPG